MLLVWSVCTMNQFLFLFSSWPFFSGPITWDRGEILTIVSREKDDKFLLRDSKGNEQLVSSTFIREMPSSVRRFQNLLEFQILWAIKPLEIASTRQFLLVFYGIKCRKHHLNLRMENPRVQKRKWADLAALVLCGVAQLKYLPHRCLTHTSKKTQ